MSQDFVKIACKGGTEFLVDKRCTAYSGYLQKKIAEGMF